MGKFKAHFRSIFSSRRQSPQTKHPADAAAAKSGTDNNAGSQTPETVSEDPIRQSSDPLTTDALKTPAPSKIACLWNDAYDDLHWKLKADYEEVLKQAVPQMTEPVTGMSRSGQMTLLIQSTTKAIEDKEWMMEFRGHELKIKSLLEPVTSIVACKLLPSDVFQNLFWRRHWIGWTAC